MHTKNQTRLCRRRGAVCTPQTGHAPPGRQSGCQLAAGADSTTGHVPVAAFWSSFHARPGDSFLANKHLRFCLLSAQNRHNSLQSLITSLRQRLAPATSHLNSSLSCLPTLWLPAGPAAGTWSRLAPGQSPTQGQGIRTSLLPINRHPAINNRDAGPLCCLASAHWPSFPSHVPSVNKKQNPLAANSYRDSCIYKPAFLPGLEFGHLIREIPTDRSHQYATYLQLSCPPVNGAQHLPTAARDSSHKQGGIVRNLCFVFLSYF